jgi:spore germination cell wall hydrolase CwlJ-like protein
LTRQPIGFAVRTASRIAAGLAATLVLLATVAPGRAQDVAMVEMPAATAGLAASAEPAPAPALTSAVLAAYIARQQAQKGFDIFGAAPRPQLTSAMVSAYAATHYRNSALDAIELAATPAAPLGTTFQAPEPPSITDEALARYAQQRFQPTEKKVRHAVEERNCLSTAIYHEARGESDTGQWAVANVIINRAMSKRFPSSMCGVVYQNADQGRFHCQFTFACDGHPDTATERRAWAKAKRIAAAAYSEYQRGERPGVLPGSALYYHTRAVSPGWSNMRRVAQIGAHVFYAPM